MNIINIYPDIFYLIIPQCKKNPDQPIKDFLGWSDSWDPHGWRKLTSASFPLDFHVCTKAWIYPSSTNLYKTTVLKSASYCQGMLQYQNMCLLCKTVWVWSPTQKGHTLSPSFLQSLKIIYNVVFVGLERCLNTFQRNLVWFSVRTSESSWLPLILAPVDPMHLAFAGTHHHHHTQH